MTSVGSDPVAYETAVPKVCALMPPGALLFLKITTSPVVPLLHKTSGLPSPSKSPTAICRGSLPPEPVVKVKRWKEAVEKMGGVVDDVIEVVYLCEDSDVEDVDIHLRDLKGAFPSLRFRRGFAEDLGYEAVGGSEEREYDRDWKEMALLSQCDWFVIPNSSFSWWAATFSSLMEDGGSRETGLIERGGHWVYYPSVWFGPNLTPISDVRDMLNQTGWKRV